MIRFEDVYISFASKKVLRGVTFHIHEGETTVIMGPSGCGKTVTIKLSVGLMKPDAGNVFVYEQNVSRMSEKDFDAIRKRVGMLFQSAALFDSMTVGENVAFMLTQHTNLGPQEKARIVAEKLEMVGLPDTENLRPAELSGGMRKRVGLARALAMDPDIVFYDEPTTGLDPIMTEEINQLILNLAQTLKITSVVVTHDMRSAFTIADRIVMMHQGQILATGTPDEIRHSKDALVQRFIHGRRE